MVKRRIEVFAASTDAIQVVWRGRGAGFGVLEVGGRGVELSATDELGAATFRGLDPDTAYDVVLDGKRHATARTLPRPAGRMLGRVATVSDLHVGEIGTGHFPRIRSQRRPGAWRDAHPVWCLDACLDEIAAWSPDLLVAKGDLAHRNLPDEYDVVGKALLGQPAPVLAIPGNHDGGNLQHSSFDDEMDRIGLHAAAVQHHDLDSAVVVVADTRVDGHHSGTITAVSDEICRTAATGRPALVLLHHQLMTERIPHYIPTGVPKGESDAFLDALDIAAPGALVSSGHTHRHRARRHRSITVTEVGSTKDFPGTWGWYEVYDGGITQTAWRIEEPRAIAWTELTKQTARGVWARWAPGSYDDRCLVTG